MQRVFSATMFFSLMLLFSPCLIKDSLGYFGDEFEIINENTWTYINNGGNIEISDGVIRLTSNGFSFPVVYSKSEEIFPADGNSSLEIRFRYTSFGSMGAGIGIGFTGDTGYNFFQFSIWQDAASNAFFSYNDFSTEKYKCRDFTPYGDLADRVNRPLFLGYDWHTLQVDRVGGDYYVYIDKNDHGDDPIFLTTAGNQCYPESIVIGNSLTGGGVSWNNMEIDYIRVSEVGGQTSKKIFIIPGLGASWNERAMVFGDKVGDGDWRMTPFVKNYDGLLVALESKGLKRGVDYFVWNYDWRRPIADIADSLDQFIDDKTDESSKIGLVGHSLGGLVAREWGQKHTGDGRVEKIVTVGSPHFGVTKAYKAWNGVVVSDRFDFSAIALKIMLMLQRRNFETDVAAVRNFAPVLKDLLPVFDFAKINGQTVLVGGMAVKNGYLLTANLMVSELFPILEAVAAKGTPTEEWLNLGKRSVYDQAFGIWPDGRWIGSVSGEGDGTVLLKSAKFDSDNYWQIESDHGMMVDKSKEKIFEYLGLNYDEEIEGIADDWANKKVFYLGSPARMSVTCEGAAEVEDEMGFVVLEDDSKECEVRLQGQRDGTYHLVVGNVADENDWSYFEDEIKAGETRTMVLSADGNLVGESSKDYLLGLMRREMRALAGEGYGGNQSLNQAVVRLAVGEARPILDSMMAFRKQSQETKRSGVVLSYVEKLLVWENGGGSQKVAWQEVFRAWRLKNLADYNGDAKSRWKIYPSTFASVNYLLMDRLLTEALAAYKKNDWPQTIAKSIIVSKLSEQIW